MLIGNNLSGGLKCGWVAERASERDETAKVCSADRFTLLEIKNLIKGKISGSEWKLAEKYQKDESLWLFITTTKK